MAVPLRGLVPIRQADWWRVALVRLTDRKRRFPAVSLVRQTETMNVYHYPLGKLLFLLSARKGQAESGGLRKRHCNDREPDSYEIGGVTYGQFPFRLAWAAKSATVS